MINLKNVSILCNGFKCFGKEPNGYETLLPINLVVGRNNSGKSTLIDLIECSFGGKDLSNFSHKGMTPKISILVKEKLSREDIASVFLANTSSSGIGNHWEYGKRFINQEIFWWVDPSQQKGLFTVGQNQVNQPEHNFFTQLIAKRSNPLAGKIFKRISSERDVTTEADKWPVVVSSNGSGVTNAIRQFITHEKLDMALVEDKVLKELNEIFSPDVKFERIIVRQLDSPPGQPQSSAKWEIYLSEEDKGNIALSKSGSGLKTILLVLTYLYLLPKLESNLLSSYVFGFEELENNLHPALQRRLYLYLKRIAAETGCMFFFTTHSSVAIDLFGKDGNAQILHVTHDGEIASVKRISSYIHTLNILEDLGARASDLLQANCLVWVEGPSDRLYFNKWIELLSGGKLSEGTHYQCVFYGGKLLSHLSATDTPGELSEKIKMLSVNKNALLIIDSDLNDDIDEINETKKRLIKEVSDIGGSCWVTAGKEIENYLPIEAIRIKYEKDEAPAIGKYQSYQKYVENLLSGEGVRFSNNKVEYAKQIIPLIKKENIENLLDLKEKVHEFIGRIEEWNGINTRNT